MKVVRMIQVNDVVVVLTQRSRHHYCCYFKAESLPTEEEAVQKVSELEAKHGRKGFDSYIRPTPMRKRDAVKKFNNLVKIIPNIEFYDTPTKR